MVPKISIPRLYFMIIEALVKMASDRIVVLEHPFSALPTMRLRNVILKVVSSKNDFQVTQINNLTEFSVLLVIYLKQYSLFCIDSSIYFKVFVN
jgi:hypothetical protein